MRLSCLSTVSLLAVIFSPVSGGDCALFQPGKRRRGARQDSLSSSSDEEPKLKLKRLHRAEDLEQNFKRMTITTEDVMELEDASSHGMEGPEVLRMDRLAFDQLGMDMKIQLTRGLSAGEWDELIQNLWVEDEDSEKNVSILCYTLDYDEERRFEMLKEALTENLEHLFMGMCSLAYIPPIPEVMQLLERGLKVYPHLRHWILLSIYQLEYPTAQWHFDNSDEDVDLLKHLISRGYIKREAITGHLAEIATLYPLEIFNSLLEKQIPRVEDLCRKEVYRKLCGLGGKEYLEWARDNCDVRPDQGCIDAAVSGGHRDVVEFIAEQPGLTLLPSQKAVNEAAAKGHIEVLELVATLEREWHRLYPDQSGFYLAAARRAEVDGGTGARMA